VLEPLAKGETDKTKIQARDLIKRHYSFKDFNHAFAFMNVIGKVADKMDHHPEWTHFDNEVQIQLSTHDAGGISVKDLVLAKAIDLIEDRINAKGVTHFLDESFVSREEILQLFK